MVVSVSEKNPFRIMTKEHYPIIEVASALSALKITHDIDPETLKKAVEFIKRFADQYHHEKEEKIVFEQAKKKKIETSPIEAMEREHETTRERVREAVESLENGDLKNSIVNLREWGNFIPDHIDRENHSLFPGLDGIFDYDEKEEFLREFERIDDELGGYDKMERMADEIFVEILKKTGNAIVEARSIPREDRDEFVVRLSRVMPENATLTVMYDEKSEELERMLEEFEIEEIKKKGVYAFRIKKKKNK